MDIDVRGLFAKILSKRGNDYDYRVTSNAITLPERRALFEYWRGGGDSNNIYRKNIDDAVALLGNKPKSGVYDKNPQNGLFAGISEVYPSDSAVTSFTTRILIPAIRAANDNPARTGLLTDFIIKSPTPLPRREIVAASGSGGGGPVVPYQQLEDIADAELAEVALIDHADDTVVNNFCRIMEEFIDETNETGPQMCQNIISLLLICGARALQLINFIKYDDRKEFENTDFEGRIWKIYEIFLKAFDRLISYTIGRTVLFIIIVLVLYQFSYGKILIDAILVALNLLILNITGIDIRLLITEIKEEFILSLTDFFTNIMREVLESLFLHKGKGILGEIIGQEVKGAVGEAVPQIVEQVTNVIADNAAAQTGQIMGAITDSAAAQTGQIVGAITDTAALHSSEIVQSTTILARQMLNANGRQLLTFLGPIAAIPVSRRLEGMLDGIGAASVSMDELAEKVREADEVLDNILRQSHFTLYEAITAGRDLNPSQIEQIVEMTVDRLKTQDPNLIRATIQGVQQLLTTTTARALMAAPAIQDLLNVGPRRLMERGGRRTRKNKRARKGRKSRKSRISRKARKGRKSRRYKK